MNEKTIKYELTDKEAVALDEMYLKNKSLVSQMAVLKDLANMTEDSILYYINTLVEELFVKPDQLDKYLKAITKQSDMPVTILINFLKVLFANYTKIDSYELFRKHVLVILNKENIDHEVVLKDFI